MITRSIGPLPNNAKVSKAFWSTPILLAAVVAACIAPSQSTSAWTFKVLHSFCAEANCADGANPQAGLIMDGAGNLFGTTSSGGDNNNNGTVFELVPNAAKTKWTQKVIYSFCAKANCVDGGLPAGVLIMDGSGNLFGTTVFAGKNGEGTVFELVSNAAKTKWTQKALYSFCAKANCADGAYPLTSLIMDGSGNLFGTTSGDSTINQGTVFELVRNAATGKYSEKEIYTFCVIPGCADGSLPEAGLIMDSAGNLFGTANGGGSSNKGTVFELVPNAAKTKWTQKVLYNFCASAGCADGSEPESVLIMDGKGRLFGTTFGGGNNNKGTVFELVPNAAKTKWTQKVLYNFCAKASCADGANPLVGLTMDGSGNLFGTTSNGGNNDKGTVFELMRHAATGIYTQKVLYSFCAEPNCTDGSGPIADLIMDGSGNLFGTTNFGGKYVHYGIVFELVND